MTEPVLPPDERMDRLIGGLLRAGVLLAAAVGLAGGILFLTAHGGLRADFGVFRGQPASLRSVAGVVQGVVVGDRRALIQLGLLLLIATPIARVALSLVAFARQRDRTYVAVTAIVLAVLLASLLAG